MLPLHNVLDDCLLDYLGYLVDISISTEFRSSTNLDANLILKKLMDNLSNLLSSLQAEINNFKTQCLFANNLSVPLTESQVMDENRVKLEGGDIMLGNVADSKVRSCKLTSDVYAFCSHVLMRIASIRKHLCLKTSKVKVITFLSSRLRYFISPFCYLIDFLIIKQQSFESKAVISIFP